MYKLLTFESWVTRQEWYRYAKLFSERVPFLLVDRSPCTDPYFDPFANTNDRRPVISGLCRARRNFNIGDIYIYVTRIDRRIFSNLSLESSDSAPKYYGVAALKIKKVYNSHDEASRSFSSRQYVANPKITPYPPNLAFKSCGSKTMPEAATEKDCCIIFDNNRRARIPGESSIDEWKSHYNEYYLRQRNRSLRAAECEVLKVNDREALKLEIHKAPLLTADNWGGVQLNVQGVNLTDSAGRSLVNLIANHQ